MTKRGIIKNDIASVMDAINYEYESQQGNVKLIMALERRLAWLRLKLIFTI